MFSSAQLTSGANGGKPAAGTPTPISTSLVDVPARFHACVEIDPVRVNRDIGQIADEVISHLTNHPGATGEALLAACQAGAMDVQMDWIQLGPWTSPDEKGFGFIPQFTERVVGYGLMVDPANGKRIFMETGKFEELE